MRDEDIKSFQSNELLELFLSELRSELPHLEAGKGDLTKIKSLASLMKLDMLKQAIESISTEEARKRLVSSLKEIACQTAETLLSFLKNSDSLVALIESSEVTPLDPSLFKLFRSEVEKLTAEMSKDILLFEEGGDDPAVNERLMRSAHSLKGACRLLHLGELVELSHAMEECFLRVKRGGKGLQSALIDKLLEGIDLFSSLAGKNDQEILTFGKKNHERMKLLVSIYSGERELEPQLKKEDSFKETLGQEAHLSGERLLRVSSDAVNKLLGFAGEVRVESAWLEPFNKLLIELKKAQVSFERTLEASRNYFSLAGNSPLLTDTVSALQHQSSLIRKQVEELLADFDRYTLRQSSLSEKLFSEVLSIRMRPFSDGLSSLPRLVRDLSHECGKRVKLQIRGAGTLVDRDILDKLEVPLQHLVQNAIDHGIESPDERIKAGKPPEGSIEIVASERGGMLIITITDDGRGVDIKELKERALVEKTLSKEYVDQLSEKELLEFLFLPGFSTAKKVTDISGRGIGLNIVQSIVSEFGGEVFCKTSYGNYFFIQIALPLTLSIVRALIVEISGELFAFPISKLEKALQIKEEDIYLIEGREYIHVDEMNLGLFSLSHLFGFEKRDSINEEIHVLVIHDRESTFALVVDCFLEEKDIVLHELDPELGKVPCVASCAFVEDGAPLLVVDVDDVSKLIVKSVLEGSIDHHDRISKDRAGKVKKRVLVVDDSVTVREVVARLLQTLGFEVHSAIDGLEGWSAVRLANYDLVVTDVDMPRLNGIELTRLIREDLRLSKTPILVVSYKDREEDRRAAIEAGADTYLTKSSFQDEQFAQAVMSLIQKEEGL